MFRPILLTTAFLTDYSPISDLTSSSECDIVCIEITFRELLGCNYKALPKVISFCAKESNVKDSSSAVGHV